MKQSYQSIGNWIVYAIITQLCNFCRCSYCEYSRKFLKNWFWQPNENHISRTCFSETTGANAWETQLVFQRLWTIKQTSAALWAFYFSSPRSRRYRSHSHQNSHHALVFSTWHFVTYNCWVLVPAAFSGNSLRTPKLASPIISPKPRALRSLFQWLSFFSNRALTLPETMNHFPPGPPA